MDKEQSLDETIALHDVSLLFNTLTLMIFFLMIWIVITSLNEKPSSDK